MRKDICMILPCVECGIKHEIPTKEMDNFNIYRKWSAKGFSEPQLLCRKCTDIQLKKAGKP